MWEKGLSDKGIETVFFFTNHLHKGNRMSIFLEKILLLLIETDATI
ncbi:hypothetical protein N784_14380 [Pontibacillus litoralis JSM 072002]|uniref:Uncharacterized protein n=1 Tax=Pontibacillus litoralis JSM 072002 TaxID=1385512 RepID=A0A0A5G9G3_9BACI|nr:hypothetical protein N784_14380 [Pontibacillus litoralis JSM 072002]